MINVHVKTQIGSNTRSDTLTRDLTQPKSLTRDPVPSLLFWIQYTNVTHTDTQLIASAESC